MATSTRRIELLAPARNKEIAIEAITHGADAVYMGAHSFGARVAAGNSLDDMAQLVAFAHQFNAKVYATVNTIIYDDELRNVEKLIKNLYRIGIDALIVQDMGILRLDIPPIELHASTQCDIRTPEKARFLESLGFSQLVLARELSLTEIASICDSVNVPLESFIHGALCVSYSGRCQASEILKGRSANRGECAQICRLPFDLIDDKGNILLHNKHLLSLRDLNQSGRIEKMLSAGVSSFKIEGRLKDMSYVKNVVAFYRNSLDKIINESNGKYTRSSIGHTEYSFTPDLSKSFNRSFTHYFIDSHNQGKGEKIASIDTPKSRGERIGTVEKAQGKTLKIISRVKLNNGDGLSYFTKNNEYCGFRINTATNNIINTLNPLNIAPGTTLFRTYDKAFEDQMAKDSGRRFILIDIELKYANGVLSLHITDEYGISIAVSHYLGDIEAAKSPQAEKQRSIISKLGNTIFRISSIKALNECFIPVSVIAQLRRDAIESLTRAYKIRHRFNYRKAEDMSSTYFATTLTDSDNVANSLAEKVYTDHGIESIEPAIEISQRTIGNHIAMYTRYCIRRELGACRKTSNANRLPEKIFLRYANSTTMRIECDCKKCEMKLYVENKF